MAATDDTHQAAQAAQAAVAHLLEKRTLVRIQGCELMEVAAVGNDRNENTVC
jgi:hypothetical protein